jgi:hypothetical protein
MNLARRNQIARKDLCAWCAQRLPLNGIARSITSVLSDRRGLPRKTLYTLFDVNDARRPAEASFANFLHFALEYVEAGYDTDMNVIPRVANLRFDIRGSPGRVYVPRCGPDRLVTTYDIEAKFTAYAQFVTAQNATNIRNNNDANVGDDDDDDDDDGMETVTLSTLKEHLDNEKMFFEGLNDERLKLALLATWQVRQQAVTAVDADDADVTRQLTASTAFISTAMIMTALETMSFVSRRSIHSMMRTNGVHNNISMSAFERCTLALFAPIRTLDEALLYRRQLRQHFNTFPLCQPVFAEATAFERRSVTTLITNRDRSLETTLDNMFFNKIIERPAALAVPGLLEFLFINAHSIDSAPRVAPQSVSASAAAATTAQATSSSSNSAAVADAAATYNVDDDDLESDDLFNRPTPNFWEDSLREMREEAAANAKKARLSEAGDYIE